MRRNMDLIRRILCWVRDKEIADEVLAANNFPGDDDRRVVQYHAKLCYQAGFVEADNLRPDHGCEMFLHRLTWAGHDHLDACVGS